MNQIEKSVIPVITTLQIRDNFLMNCNVLSQIAVFK